MRTDTRARTAESNRIVYGAVAGALGGLAGTWAMSEAQRFWTYAAEGRAPASSGGKHDAREWQERSELRNANEIAAQRVARTVVGRCLTQRELAVAAPAVHYAFGTVLGALYGCAVEVLAGSRIPGASAYGAGVWLVADELAMPVLGLSNPPTARTGEQHAQSLASHLVYAYTTELVRRVIRPRFPRN
jgi:putative membrane protein